ncbi:ankyrin repeat domain-containing protein [Archangium sp.]|uniref:ankyrin repeat domain-containing protein n=1 Tax=Archangium sp. TaxID=1872627 RepID=UPI002D6F95F6|nr:ankyrin repeat domain-containing protein [Archangium sp.]HYO51953.1 ankyrin repeat domain-containing protein [Archangium sp.]
MSKELFEAIETHDLDRLATLLDGGSDPNAVKAEWPKWPPLHAAINELEEGGSIESVILLLRHGARIDGAGSDRDATPLLMALFRKHLEAARILLAAGANPNLTGDEGDSPLRVCAEQGEHAMAAMLLRCGATRTIDEAGGLRLMTALGLAASRLDIPMLELLLRAGADPEVLDLDRQTAREHLPPREAGNHETWDAAAALLAGRSHV